MSAAALASHGQQPSPALAWNDWLSSAAVHAVLLAALAWFALHTPATDALYAKLELPIQWAEQPAEPQPVVNPPLQPKVPLRQEIPQQPAIKKEAKQPRAKPVAAKAAPAEPATQTADVAVPAAPSPTPPSAAPAPAAEPAQRPSAAGQPDWRLTLDAMLRKHKHYPLAARRMRQQGTVTVQAAFAADGELLNCSVVDSSGFQSLDDAALQLVRQASTAAHAVGTPGRNLQLRIPVVYELKES